MDYEGERRGSKNRALERSISYSAAIGNGSGRSSIEIPAMVNSEVYTNEEIKKQYRISQSYVEGKEITFPVITNIENKPTVPPSVDSIMSDSQYTSEDDTTDNGLTMTIDVEDSPKETRHISDASTQLVTSSVTNDTYDRIDFIESVYTDPDETLGSYGPNYSTPYTRRSKRVKKHRRQHGRPIRSRRVVNKSGEENVPVRSNIPAKSIKYMRDIVNTVINSKWRFIILLMVVAHFIFWFIFAGIWYAVAASYQDDIGDGKEHCVTGTSSFAGLLMMSVETQMTIGYGVRYPSEECPEAIIVMVIEIVAGTALSGGLSSLLFTKLVRPNRHVSSVGFSKKATVCLRDGELCLQFRVWDLLNLHIIGSTITAYMLKPIRTLEGEIVHNYIHQLKLKEARAFLIWPITVVHVIDSESPLYDLSAQDMMDYRFEIVVCLTGSSKNMGTVTQSRTSYLSKEIIWGHRFKNVLRRQHGRPIRSRRVVNKSGEENVPVRSNIPAKSIKYMRDIVNTVINSKWRFIILLMVVAHFIFWFIFAGIWYAVAASYQDDIGDGKEHCVTGTSSFAGLLMMSVETQMTIGYGVRYPSEECPEAIIVMVIEVCLRDGELCLQFRVWDLLNLHIIGSTITAYMLKPIRTLEGEIVHNYIHQLKLKEARAFLIWPITVVHVIDSESPLYDLSAQDMMDYRFEIVVCLTGSSKNMGTVTQSRTSYLSKEIIWGHRFKNVLSYSKKDEAYIIDIENLNSVEQVETPLCSASRLKDFEELKPSQDTPLSVLSPLPSLSPTNESTLDSSTVSRVGDSVPSSPIFTREGTQRSLGWHFTKFYPETNPETQGAVQAS